jgi:hypothetical protein
MSAQNIAPRRAKAAPMHLNRSLDDLGVTLHLWNAGNVRAWVGRIRNSASNIAKACKQVTEE